MKTMFGQNLKTYRTAKKMSQNHLALLIGVTQQCVSEWERGAIEPTLSFIWKLANIFDTTMDELCGRSNY